MAIFGPQEWVNPFGKISLFFTFQTFCFYTLDRRVFVLKRRKTYFRGLHCVRKKVGKMAIFGPKAWVNPFGKISLFRPF